MGKSKMLTPLQQEAARIEADKKRRQDALKAAQEFALRRGPAISIPKKAPSSTVMEETEEVTADFDSVRQALQNERRRESNKNQGTNPRYIAATDVRDTYNSERISS